MFVQEMTLEFSSVVNCVQGLACDNRPFLVSKNTAALRVPAPMGVLAPPMTVTMPFWLLTLPKMGLDCVPAKFGPGSTQNVKPYVCACPVSVLSSGKVSFPAKPLTVNVVAVTLRTSASVTLNTPSPLSVPVTVTSCPTVGCVMPGWPASSEYVYVAVPSVIWVAVMFQIASLGA